MATSENELLRMAYHLNVIEKKIQNYHIQYKNKSMVVWGNHIQKVKIVINDNIIEQGARFKYLGYRISEYKRDLEYYCKHTTQTEPCADILEHK
jgi:hypothetical protein